MLVVQRHGDRLRVDAPAKINVGLRLLGKRPDGYHEIESVVMAVGLTDTLEAVAADGSAVTLSVRPEGADAPADESNLVLRAARCLQEASGSGRGAHLTLWKRIPARKGLGGGSSDAAAALMLLSRLWRLDWPAGRLAALGADLGSDVPFFLNGPLAVVRGRGEIVEPLHNRVNVWVVLIVPACDLSTKEVYRCSKPPLTRLAEGVSLKWIPLLLEGHVEERARHLVNDLEPAAQALCSDLVNVRAVLEKAGLVCVSMTGSGSAMYALVARHEDAQSMARTLELDAGTTVHVLAPWNSSESLGE